MFLVSELSTIKELEQGRAKFAYKQALEGRDIEKYSKEYKAYVRKIPTYIKTNGLGETFAFVKAKKKADKSKSGYAYYVIYEQTTKWLKDEKKLLDPKMDLLEWIISLDSSTYRAITNEILSFFKWLSRFSEGLIEGEPDDE